MERSTRQREAIRSALEAAGRPLGPGEMLEAARKAVPGLGQATVYRTIKSLVDEGALHTVELPGEPARYELSAAAAHHHHHFRCDQCERVFDVEGCPKGIESIAPEGFQVRDHEVILYGTCADCA